MTKGFICTATSVEYVELAYWLALSLQASQNQKLTVIVDEGVKITDEQHLAFDAIVVVPPHKDKFASRLQVLDLSPYDQTILVDADMLILNDISDWWEQLALQPITWGKAVTYRGDTITNRTCRRVFDVAHLDDVYSAFFYFDKTLKAQQFFIVAKALHQKWPEFRKGFPMPYKYLQVGDTDVVFGATSALLQTTNDIVWQPPFVHFKPELQNTTVHPLKVATACYPYSLYIEQYRQIYPIHYHHKTWVDLQLQHWLRGYSSHAIRSSQ